jgi:hypothetical protein
MVLIRLFLAVQVTLLVSRKGRRDLIWLTVYYFATCAFDISFALYGLSRATVQSNGQLPVFGIFQCLFGLLGDLAMVLFVQQTFYRDRKSPSWFFILSALGVFGVGLSLVFQLRDEPVFNPFVWGWLASVALRAYRQLAADPHVEDWIKARYRLVITYSFMLMASVALPLALGLYPAAIPPANMLISAIAIFLQYLVWVMPEGFRKWLNRKQGVHTEEEVHQQALAIFEILGTAMAEGTGLSKIIALFAIRKAISKEIKTEEPTKIEAYALAMGYEAWSALLNDADLNLILKNSSINVNPDEVIERAKRALIEKQSLFTMQAT